jgi:hypothetical protein
MPLSALLKSFHHKTFHQDRYTSKPTQKSKATSRRKSKQSPKIATSGRAVIRYTNAHGRVVSFPVEHRDMSYISLWGPFHDLEVQRRATALFPDDDPVKASRKYVVSKHIVGTFYQDEHGKLCFRLADNLPWCQIQC